MSSPPLSTAVGDVYVSILRFPQRLYPSLPLAQTEAADMLPVTVCPVPSLDDVAVYAGRLHVPRTTISDLTFEDPGRWGVGCEW